MTPFDVPSALIYDYILHRAYVGRSHCEITRRFSPAYAADVRNECLNRLAMDGKIRVEMRKPYKGPMKHHYYASEHAPKIEDEE